MKNREALISVIIPVYNGEKYLLGNVKLISDVKITEEGKEKAAELSAQGKTVLYFANGKQVLALIAVADTLKDGSAQAIAMLKARSHDLVLFQGPVVL